MVKRILFWVSLVALFASWEAVLLRPAAILLWFFLCLIAGALLSWTVYHASVARQGSLLADRISLVLFGSGAFWWLLWQDFATLKFVFPVGLWFVLLYVVLAQYKNKSEEVIPQVRYILFLGVIFFWATVTFGSILVIGWSLWKALLLFLALFSASSWSAAYCYLPRHAVQKRAWLVLMLYTAEAYAVLVWLPFAETTLALVLSIFIMLAYDLLKYYAQPELIRRGVVARKLFLYLLLLFLAFVMTPWY